MIDFDVETTGLQPYHGDRPFIFQFGDDETANDAEKVVVLHHPEDRDEIQRWLDRGADEGLRAWNSKFDLAHAEQAGYRLPPDTEWYDGMVEAKLMDERFSAALKVRGERVLGRKAARQDDVRKWLADETKRRRQEQKEGLYAWLESQGIEQKRNRLPQVPPGLDVPPELATFQAPDFSDVPFELMRPYAVEDIVLTRALGDWYGEKMPERLREVYALERRVLAALYAIEKRGLPMDRAEAELSLDASSRALDDALAECRRIAGKANFNPGSPEQIKMALERAGADLQFLQRNRPTLDRKTGLEKPGSVKLDEDGLRSLQHPLAEAVLRFRGEKKAFGTYFMPLVRDQDDRRQYLAPDDRVHTTYLQVGARTGRMSSMDPNVQNIPRDDLRYRYLVKAPEGKVLVTADMDSIEARVAAVYTGPGRWREAVVSGDIHQVTADMVGLQDKQRAIGVEPARQRGKKLNYLILYGGGVRAIRQWFHVSQGEAREYLTRFREAYPELGELSDRVQWKLAQQGYIETVLGRRLRLEKSVREEGYKFINYLIQGTAGDLFKLAIARMHEYGVPLIGVFHDEALAEVPEYNALETARLMELCLTDFPMVTEPVPFLAEAATVTRWSGAKDPDYIPDFLQQEVAA